MTLERARRGAKKRWALAFVPTISAWNMSPLPKVIVVDDTEDHACVMAIGLRFEGFEVETALDAEGALRVMAGRQVFWSRRSSGVRKVLLESGARPEPGGADPDGKRSHRR